MAGTAIHNKEIEKQLTGFPQRGPAGWKILGGLIRKIARGLVLKLSIDGGDIEEIDGGLHIKVNGGAAEADPWTLRMGPTSNTRYMKPGVFGGNIVPTVSGVRLDDNDPPAITIVSGQDTYIYLRCQFAKVLTDTFVSNLTIGQGDVTVVASTVALTNDVANAVANVLVATVNASGVAQHFWNEAIDWSFTDTGTNSQEVAWSFFT
jgi:hypothetical protein